MTRRRKPTAAAGWRLALASLLLLLPPGRASAGAEAVRPPPPGPRLVLLVAVDQLRRDRVDDALPGGLGRLVREGRSYTEAALDHAVTATCPGHAALSTGRQPGRTGLIDNRFIDRATMEERYCVEDPAPDARVLGGEEGCSPRLLRVDSLGDWMKAADPRTRVLAVSGKDRAAIALGGRGADAAYWFESEGPIGFTTSRYYRSELPAWVRAWNGEHPPRDGFLADLPESWVHELPSAGPRPDDYPAESGRYGRTSPHPLRDGDAETFAERVAHSPYLDLVTLDFARELVVHEQLGRGPATDLLALSLSASDRVGHLYGPESQEARDALLRLDSALGDFLDFLQARLGPGALLVALSSDHGVLPLPEWLVETGRSECPVRDGRANLVWLLLRFHAQLHFDLSPFGLPRRWVRTAGAEITVDRRLAASRGVPVGRVVAEAERWLESQPIVAEAWTAEEIRTGKGELAELYRHSYDPERSGDLVVQLARTCTVSLGFTGTGHGTPYRYDRAVPILLFGPGVRPGRDPSPARTVDVAPTLARLVGVPVPGDVDGHPLPGALPPAAAPDWGSMAPPERAADAEADAPRASRAP